MQYKLGAQVPLPESIAIRAAAAPSKILRAQNIARLLGSRNRTLSSRRVAGWFGSVAVVEAHFSPMAALGRIADGHPGRMSALTNSGRSDALKWPDLNGSSRPEAVVQNRPATLEIKVQFVDYGCKNDRAKQPKKHHCCELECDR